MDESRAFPVPVTQGLALADRGSPALCASVGGGRATFLTIVTADRAGQARQFARSARICHPDARFVVLVAGAGASPRLFDNLYDRVIAADELDFAGLADMRFRYSLSELCFALKPWVLRHLLDESIDGPIYYFDSDIELFSPLIETEAALSVGANLVLTPHILQTGRDQEHEKALLRSGSFNAGFFAVAPTPAARAFVAWWADRVRTGGTHDPLEGTYGDQKWLELAPSICEGVAVLRHPGYNFAYWNAHERPLRCLGGVWTAADHPLRFIHYSRWDLRQEDAEQYLARFFVSGYRPFADLFAEYRQKVDAESLDCGPIAVAAAASATVSPLVREAYARHAAAIDGDAAAVLAHAVAVLNAPSPAHPDKPDLADLPITILYDEIWRHHADLRDRFTIARRAGRIAYLRWLIDTGAAELAIPKAFLGPARAALEHERVRELEAAEDLPAPLPVLATGNAPPEAAQESLRRQQDDIRLLVRANKGLRREVQSLRVRRWRNEEKIAALEADLAQLRQRRHGVVSRWMGGLRAGAAGQPGRRMIAGSGPFFERGFQLGEGAVIDGTTIRRRKGAPSGMLVFGPYIALSPGCYGVVIDARLYRHLTLFADFRADVVYDGARSVAAVRRFRLYSGVRRRCELRFAIAIGSAAGDVEIRIWARRGTPLEIGLIELYRLPEEAPPTASVNPQHG
jgi:hypothetical protein